MKSKNISVLVLSISLILVSLILVSSFGLSKPNPKPEQNSEWITFSGDLYGDQVVEGCCGNAGPFPSYTMTLSDVFKDVFPAMIGEPLGGNIFMNVFMDLSLKGHGKKKSYIVQFWWPKDSSDYFIEIRGGDIEENKKTKKLTVTFDEVPCKIWIDNILTAPVPVTFTLTREQL